MVECLLFGQGRLGIMLMCWHNLVGRIVCYVYSELKRAHQYADEYTHIDSNPFSYLGDGFTHLEHVGGDRTWNLGTRTDSMKNHPALKRGRIQI